ncbi:MAG TPA: TRAP transporter substrate-binding protein DctP [Thermodesulfobacteriota bacterium]|nr:TRAP transporter substrate-binding protein DctP [Thermodesulfobacteriota bacterium]
MNGMTKVKWLVGLVSIFFVLDVIPISSMAAEKTVTLKAVSAFPQNNKMNDAFWMLQKKVKEKSKGQLEIAWGGGPEAIPTFQLVEALRNGVVDIAWTAHTFNVAQLAVAEGAKLSKLTPWKEREKGVYDFYQKVYQSKLNAYFLGRGTPGLTYNLYTTVPVKNIGDFKGMTIRVTPAYKVFVEALGAAPVTTDPGEVFTSLERKMVRGYGWPSLGISDFGWDEVTKFVIEPAFYQVDVIALVHINAWNKLPKDLQDALNISMQEVEREAFEHFAKLISQDREKIKKKGVQEIRLSGEEGEKYLQTAYEASWKEVLRKDPQLGAQLRDLLTK